MAFSIIKARGEAEASLRCFFRMRAEKQAAASTHAYVAVLKACSFLASTSLGGDDSVVEVIHRLAKADGWGSQVNVANALINAYARCRRLCDARAVFERMQHRTVVSWNTLLFAHVENGESRLVSYLYSRMLSEGAIAQNSLTCVAVLKALAEIAEEQPITTEGLAQVTVIRLRAFADGFQADIKLASTLIDLYWKCGRLDEARSIFQGMPVKDSVAWNAIILGHAENGEPESALELFHGMQQKGYTPDALTFEAVLKACGALGAAELGSRICSTVASLGLDRKRSELGVGVVDFYAKCGCMLEARQAFAKLHESVKAASPVALTALMAGYARLGDGQSAISLFEEMERSQAMPDGVTFSCLLTACAHAGMVAEGLRYFAAMEKYGLQPDLRHYTCIVDMLCRANRMGEAAAVVKAMPVTPDAALWRSVLSACRKWGNLELGRVAFRSLLRLQREQEEEQRQEQEQEEEQQQGVGDPRPYVLMSGLYAARGMWREQMEVAGMRLRGTARKQPGMSWWTSKAGCVHAFTVSE